MIVAIHQPEHLPWLGFFNKMMNADEMIILDNVQYRKRYFQNRNKILVNGEGKYIGVPVNLDKYRNKLISDMKIYPDIEVPWKGKYLRTIELNYKHHHFYQRYYPFLEELVNSHIDSLYEFNMRLIVYFANELKIKTKIKVASDLSPTGSKSDLILDLAQRAGANVYLSGPSGRDYMELDKYAAAHIEVWFNDFEHPQYMQKGMNTFVSHLSVLDLLMNVGPDQGREVIQSGTVITKII